MDACSWNLICAPAAFWTGILYDAESLEEAEILSKDWTNQDRKVLNLSVPEQGLKLSFRNTNLLEIAKKLYLISEKGLERRNILSTNKQYNEATYLNKIKSNLNEGKSPADKLLDKYNGTWNQSVKPIYSELIF